MQSIFKSDHIIKADLSLHEALRALNSLSGRSMVLFVTNNEDKLRGTLTDGDIRRALINGVSLNVPVEQIMNRNFTAAFSRNELSAKIREASERNLKLLPLLDKGVITDIIDVRKVHAAIPVDAVIMAGGKGERLMPLTANTPKPLLEISGKPIIEYNIEALEACGVENIFVTVNYLADKIIDYFNNRTGRAKIICIKEDKPLGTLGSISLIKDFSHDDILIMNADLFTDMHFDTFFKRHESLNADITIATVPYSVSVPYAIAKTDEQWVRELSEKPVFNYLANAGVYLMKRTVIEGIVPDTRTDAPDFINSKIKEGACVTFYPVEGTWIDIGIPADYKYACELTARKKSNS